MIPFSIQPQHLFLSIQLILIHFREQNKFNSFCWLFQSVTVSLLILYWFWGVSVLTFCCHFSIDLTFLHSTIGSTSSLQHFTSLQCKVLSIYNRTRSLSYKENIQLSILVITKTVGEKPIAGNFTCNFRTVISSLF